MVFSAIRLEPALPKRKGASRKAGKPPPGNEQTPMQDTTFQLREAVSERVIVARLEVARSLWQQTIGLLGRSTLPEDSGMWLEPCNSIHSFGMQFSIDVLFLDATGCLVRAVQGLKPWRVCWPVWRARVVVELPQGFIAQRNVTLGARYVLTKVEPKSAGRI